MLRHDVIASAEGYCTIVKELYVIREPSTPSVTVDMSLLSPQAVANTIIEMAKNDDEVETFYVMFMAVNNTVKCVHKIAKGNYDSCIIDVGGLLRSAVICGAKKIVLAHTHPSGNAEPSHDDIVITKRIAEAAKIMDIIVLDHVVVGLNTNAYTSFQEKLLL